MVGSGASYSDWNRYAESLGRLLRYPAERSVSATGGARYDILLPGHGAVDLEDGYASVQDTLEIVKEVVSRRKAGERISSVNPYQWNWERTARDGPSDPDKRSPEKARTRGRALSGQAMELKG